MFFCFNYEKNSYTCFFYVAFISIIKNTPTFPRTKTKTFQKFLLLLGGSSGLLLSGFESSFQHLGAVGSSFAGNNGEVVLGQFNVVLLGLSQGLGNGTLLSGQSGATTKNFGVGVQLDELTYVGQRIETTYATEYLLAGIAENLADFFGFKKTSQVGVGHLGLGKIVALLQGGARFPGAEKFVQTSESRFGPDDKTTNMTARSQLQQVHLVDGHGFNAGDVAEGTTETFILVVNDEGTFAGNATTIAHSTTASTETLGFVHLLDVSPDLHASEEDNSLLGLLQLLYFIRDNQWEFRDAIDDVTLRLDKGWDARGSNSGNQSITTLVYVDLAVPATVGLSGGEHTTTTTHVTESTLAGTVSTTTTDTGNTGNSTTSTPRFSRGLVTGLFADSIRLTLVATHQL